MTDISPQKREHYTYCAICEQLCGLKVTTRGDAVLRIQPDKENPHNWADFCIKGATADEYRTHPARLRSPMKRVGDRYVAVSHEEAVDGIAGAFRKIIERDGPDAIGAYVGNPNAFNFANSIFHGAFMDALGSHNRYWVGSIDQNAYHYVGEQMYGSSYTTLIPDVDQCRYLLLIGSNPAVSAMGWVGSVPNGWKRVLAAVENGAKLVVVDPRRTETAKRATRHLAPLPESDWAFLLAVIHLILANGLENRAACDAASGFERVREIALAQNPASLARRCDIALSDIEQVAIGFATAESAACVARTGSAMGRNGVLAEWLSHILNLITGRTDTPGGRVLCDGVANFMKLGADVFAPARVPSRLRQWDPVAGAHALAELPDEILTPGRGQIRGLIINAGNPVISGPDGPRLDEALASLDCLVAVDLFQRESHRHAHWLIPGLHFLENEEIHVLYSSFHDVPFVQKARRTVPPPAGMRAEWEFYRDLSAALGLTLFQGLFPPEPSAVEDGLLAMGGRVDRATIEAHPHGLHLGPKTYGRLSENLQTHDRKIAAAPPALLSLLSERLLEPETPEADSRFPYQIISRRRLQTMNSWLTESSASRLREGVGSEIVINAGDAERDGLKEGDMVEVESLTAALDVRLKVSDSLRSGVAIMEYGWGSRTFDPQEGAIVGSKGINRNALVSGKDLDPLARVPRFNGTPVRIRRSAITGSA
ncbi:molybdopterin-dependent oxidoreductase [Sphingorhabdus sp. YGSMI21]|uniref:molybdopterin-containing oxidoreductase family protein n=1 Tax=Sphingorhabdus sp. YGSMI21 TaxID=2077182 RepID=UPI0013D8F3ED|nr:molybdopterin-dependent oxidoreductase [Sphingorhabdus sp. YGSMI21]